jgi:adenylate cyclase class IV
MGMKRAQFVRRLRKYCRNRNLTVSVDAARGKGSHVTLRVADRRTIVKDGELAPGYVRMVLRQLGLPEDAA